MARWPRTLWLTVFAELAKLVALATGVLVCVVAMGAAIKPLSDGNLEPGDALTFIALALLPMSAYVLPFSAGFAATLVYHRLASSNEALAAHAGGLSHRALLVPALAMGLALAGGLSVLNEQVIPRFLRQMQQLITVDLARLMAQRIERGQALNLDGTLIFADQATRVAPAPGSGAIDQVVFGGFAAIRLDAQGAPTQEVTASAATMWLFPPGTRPWSESIARSDAGDDASVLVVELTDTIAADAQGIGGFRGSSQIVMPVPNVFKDNPKFLTLGELLALRDQPERMNWVATRKRALAQELAGMQTVRELAAALAANGRATLLDERGMPVTIHARSLERTSDGAVRVRSADDAAGVRVEHSRRGDLGDVPLESVAGEALLTPAGVVADDLAPRLRLELRRVRTRDALGTPSNAAVPERSITVLGPLRARASETTEALGTLPTRQLLEVAATARAAPDATPTLQAREADLRSKVDELIREAFSKRHERIAMSLACLVIVLTGAVTALRNAGKLPLTTYVWTFIPGLLCWITISGGQQLTEKLMGQGLWLMYGGIGALAMYVLVQFRLLARN